MLSQNVYDRFIYYIPVFSLFSLVPLATKTNHRVLKFASILSLISIFAINLRKGEYKGHMESAIRDRQASDFFIATRLKMSQIKGRALVTESGRFPYYSKWEVTDSYGLNTKEFTNKTISPDFVRDNSYDLILIHPGYAGNISNRVFHGERAHSCLRWMKGDLPEGWSPQKRGWFNMVASLLQGVHREEYDLVLVPFNRTQRIEGLKSVGPFDCYFVRKEYPEKERLDAIFAENGALHPALCLNSEEKGYCFSNNAPLSE